MRNGTTRAGRRTGWVLSGLAIAFLAFDATGKLLQLKPVMAGTTEAFVWAGLLLRDVPARALIAWRAR